MTLRIGERAKPLSSDVEAEAGGARSVVPSAQVKAVAEAFRPAEPFQAAGAKDRAPWPAAPFLQALSPPPRSVRLMGPSEYAERLSDLKAKGVGVEEIGRSREGRPMYAIRAGQGPRTFVAISGAHPDEPVGTATALHLAERLQTDPNLEGLRKQITFRAIPMANPDGSARNERWFEAWSKAPDLATYLRNVRRDVPEDDVEFGFPSKPGEPVRPENDVIAKWFDSLGKIDHYASLHSMFLGGGALFLVATDDLEAARPRLGALLRRASALGLPLHDKDRFGQKGFDRIAPGLQSAPTAEAMRAFFKAGQREDVAKSFKSSSMQYVQEHNGAPIALVSEIPLVYDPRLASMKPSGGTRAEEESRFAERIEATLDEAAVLADRIEVAGGAAAAPRLKEFRRRIDAGRAAAAAMRGDLARYGHAPATEGVVLENQLNIRRRRVALLGQAAAALEGNAAPEAVSLQTDIRQMQEQELERIRTEFDLHFPTLEAQVDAQLAALLSGL